MIPSMRAACVFCGATKDYEGKLVEMLPITNRFEKRAKPVQGLGFPCARHSMQDGSKRFRPSRLVGPFFDRFGVAPLHNGCKNLLLLLVGGWCQPGQVQSLQPRSGRVQPEGSVVHGHRAWRLRLLGEWICASCPGCWCWAGVWQAGRELPRPLVVGACLRCCPVVHKTLDGLGRPFRVLVPFSGSQALHGRHVNPAGVDFPVWLPGFVDGCFLDVVRRRLCGSQEIGNGAGGIGRHDVVANVVLPCTLVTAVPYRRFAEAPMGWFLSAIGYGHVQCLNAWHMQRGVVTRQSPRAEIDVQQAGLLVFAHVGFGQWARCWVRH